MDVRADNPPPAATSGKTRISSLDTTRGLALLGIMLVNVHYFTGPVAEFYASRPGLSGGVVPAWLDEAAFFVQHALCEGRFFPLYSLMFGAGMVLICGTVAQRGGRFWTVYLRRLVALGLIGLCHGFLLWYGDILFVYSLIGVLLLVLGPLCSGRTLCTLGGCLLVVGAALTLGCMSLPQPATTSFQPLPSEVASLPPGERLLQGLSVMQTPLHPAWQELEREAYAEGPWRQAQLVRATEYGMSVFMGLLMMGPVIAGMFLTGAGLMKMGFWEGRAERCRRWLLMTGLGAGLPLSVVAALGSRLSNGRALDFWMAACMAVGPLLTLGIAASVIAWVKSGRLSRIARLLSVPGRMGLTNYLLTTVLMTFVAYHWGLGMWGRFGAAEQTGLCLVVYAALVLFSHVWLARFAAGPVEWLWKSLSYLRLTPITRSANGEQSAR